MSKNTPIRAIGAKPSQEEMEEQAKRAFIQKRNALAETILYNAVGTALPSYTSYKGLVDAAIEAADYMMEKLYSVAITEKPAEE